MMMSTATTSSVATIVGEDLHTYFDPLSTDMRSGVAESSPAVTTTGSGNGGISQGMFVCVVVIICTPERLSIQSVVCV